MWTPACLIKTASPQTLHLRQEMYSNIMQINGKNEGGSPSFLTVRGFAGHHSKIVRISDRADSAIYEEKQETARSLYLNCQSICLSDRAQ